MADGNGRALAEEAKSRWPDIKVLYTTGYTRNAIVKSTRAAKTPEHGMTTRGK